MAFNSSLACLIIPEEYFSIFICRESFKSYTVDHCLQLSFLNTASDSRLSTQQGIHQHKKKQTSGIEIYVPDIMQY
jgi:hypothetical protein